MPPPAIVLRMNTWKGHLHLLRRLFGRRGLRPAALAALGGRGCSPPARALARRFCGSAAAGGAGPAAALRLEVFLLVLLGGSGLVGRGDGGGGRATRWRVCC